MLSERLHCTHGRLGPNSLLTREPCTNNIECRAECIDDSHTGLCVCQLLAGQYPDLPAQEAGGSKVILNPPLPTVEELVAANAAAAAAAGGGKGGAKGGAKGGSRPASAAAAAAEKKPAADKDGKKGE